MSKKSGTDLILLAAAISAKLCELYDERTLSEIKTLMGLVIQNLNIMMRDRR